MPPKMKEPEVKEWVSAGFRGLIVCVVSMATFFVSQLNMSMQQLTNQLRMMESHQSEIDLKIKAIEVSRDMTMGDYKHLIQDVQDMKATLIQNTLRLQTVADFVAKHIK